MYRNNKIIEDSWFTQHRHSLAQLVQHSRAQNSSLECLCDAVRMELYHKVLFRITEYSLNDCICHRDISLQRSFGHSLQTRLSRLAFAAEKYWPPTLFSVFQSLWVFRFNKINNINSLKHLKQL